MTYDMIEIYLIYLTGIVSGACGLMLIETLIEDYKSFKSKRHADKN